MIEEFKEYLEVSPEEYRSFTRELKPEFFHIQKEEDDSWKAFYVISNEDNTLVCGNKLINEDEIHYYIVNMPDGNARKSAKPVQKIILENEEEVKAFFDILKKAKKND